MNSAMPYITLEETTADNKKIAHKSPSSKVMNS